MKKFSISKTSSVELADAKQRYLNRLPGPLDGMWESFIDLADHYLIQDSDQTFGYCVVNSDQKLVQFLVEDLSVATQVFKHVLGELQVRGAFVATCETPYLALCMDQQKSVSVNAFMYHFEQNTIAKNADFPAGSEFRITESKELELAVEFGFETLAADPDWLRLYFAERIKRDELFGLWLQGSLIATGECRLSRTQRPYADLGIVVSQRIRGQGIATNVLRQLLSQCRDRGLKPICSTERDNIAARKAIARSGFVSQHRVLDVQF